MKGLEFFQWYRYIPTLCKITFKHGIIFPNHFPFFQVTTRKFEDELEVIFLVFQLYKSFPCLKVPSNIFSNPSLARLYASSF